MPIFNLRLKRLGKKRIRSLPYELDGNISSLQELITACVRKEVSRFNQLREEPEVLPFIGPAAIERGAASGKVSFGKQHNTQKTDEDKAIETALIAWEDGLYAVFHNDEELRELSAPLDLTHGSTLTFIRLTFLTGTFW